MVLNEIKQEFTDIGHSVSDGWQRLMNSAKGALTYFSSDSPSNLPSRQEVDDEFYWPSHGWSMLGGDVFEDDKRLVVNLEVPGMSKNEIDIEIVGDSLVVQGEKRFERENTEGRWRELQCAYGRFRRVISLPAQVVSEKAKADYKNGVLRVELPKSEPGTLKKKTIKVN